MKTFERYVGAFCLTIGLLLICGIAQAQTRNTNCDAATPNNAICLDGTAPTTNVDGTPITLPLRYRWEQRLGTTAAWATVASDLLIPKYYATGLPPGTYYFRLFANCVGTGCIESAASNVTSRSATANPIQPNAPIIIIAATIREGQAPVYRIVYTARPRDGEIVFAVPESMRSVFAAR